jgi:hypothetical protein
MNRHQRRVQAARFKKVAKAQFVARPDFLRYSTSLSKLRAAGTSEDKIAEYERAKEAAAICPEHGFVEDPIVGITMVRGFQEVAFACPWCSGSEMLERWEKEGLS